MPVSIFHYSLTNMINSENATPPKCFSSFLRRLLCSGSLPTHPELTHSSESTHNLYKTNSTTTNPLQTPPPTAPGVVARLMGLDSFPNSSQTIPRSKSVNSVDFFPRFDLFHPTRVRTSVSFREVPTFLQNSQNHNLFLVCFDKDDGIRKTEVGLTLKEEKLKEFDQKNKGIRRECFDEVHGIGKTEVGLTLKEKKSREFYQRNKNKGIGRERETSNVKNKKSQSQSLKGKSEEVSPYPLKCRRRKDDDDEFSAGERKYTPRRQKYNHPLPKIVKQELEDDEEGQQECRKSKKKSKLKRTERDYTDEYCVKVLMEVCKLTEEETKGCVLMDKKMVNNFQEIIYELGHEILQVLLYEVVRDLCVSSQD